MTLVGMSGLAASAEERERLLGEIVEESFGVAHRFADGPSLVNDVRSNMAFAR